MNRDEIKNILPHREPMLLVDEVEFVDDTAIGSYTVKGDEFFLQGHYPDNPIVPGVILCEMMAQSSCLLVQIEGNKFTPYFTGLNKVKFKEKVVPGDTIIFKSQKTAQKGPFYFVSSNGYVNDKLCVTGELSFAVVQE